ncbi:MAG: zinc-ribbon domain-containing protein [Candidatus Gastranaerophilales bacterium]|nr:zinc-ribbon domain-containing protein [Candidatus Gastranaerophilales bacterium]
MFGAILVYLIVYGVWGSVWGFAVNKVVENKGYDENWFWWGFFFGLIAMLVALSKPEQSRTANNEPYFGGGESIVGPNYHFKGFGVQQKITDVPSGWRCSHCGKVNAGYVGTCGCGWDKSGTAPGKASEPQKESVENAQTQAEQNGQLKMLYCTSCGKQMEADSKFCRYCGTKAGGVEK